MKPKLKRPVSPRDARCAARIASACLQRNSLDAIQEGAPGLGQFRTVRDTVEQACTDFRLQILDLLAERRLSNAKAGRGTGEVAFFGNRQEITQVTKLHRYS